MVSYDHIVTSDLQHSLSFMHLLYGPGTEVEKHGHQSRWAHVEHWNTPQTFSQKARAQEICLWVDSNKKKTVWATFLDVDIA